MPETVDRAAEIGSALREIEFRGRVASRGRPFEVVAVSKFVPADVIGDAHRAGIRDFGENYADELIEKAMSSTLIFSKDPIRWHYIGVIQSRTIAKLAPFVAVWHSVSRDKELERIAEVAPQAKVFIQVNCGESLGRNGVALAEAAELVRQGFAHGLEVIGLMVVPPRVEAVSTAEIFKRVNDERLRLGLGYSSMGMSDDFELALSMGSTHIRIGTALFGSRTTGGNMTDQGQGGRG